MLDVNTVEVNKSMANMKRIYFYVSLFLSQQKGAYSIIMGLITVFLVMIIGFTVDGSGALLERARLAEALDQSAISIVTENNRYRDDIYKIVGENQYKERDKAIITAYIKNYIAKGEHIVNNDNIDYLCDKPKNTANNGIVSDQLLICTVNATVQRKSFLPLTLNKEVYIPETLNIGENAKARKRYQVPVPQDVMFVVDYSLGIEYSIEPDSFSLCNNGAVSQTAEKYANWRAKRCTKPSNKEVLYKTIEELSKPFFEKNTKSRLGYTAYAFGAQRLNDSVSQCVIPVILDNPYIRDNFLEYTSYEKINFFVGERTVYRVGRIEGHPKTLIDQALNHTVAKLNSKDSHWSYRTAKYLPLYLGIYPSDYKTRYDLKGNLYLDKSLQGIKTTLDSISDLDYRNKPNSWITFNKGTWEGDRGNTVHIGLFFYTTTEGRGNCLSNKNSSSTAWFDATKEKEFESFRQKIQPGIGKFPVSGLIVGTEAMTKINSDAAPAKVNTNTQRIMIIIDIPKSLTSVIGDPVSELNVWRPGWPYDSQGWPNDSGANDMDSWVKKYSKHYLKDHDVRMDVDYSEEGLRKITPMMIQEGLCDKIREKLDSLQDPAYPKVDSKLVYIGLYSPVNKNAGAWRREMPNYKMWQQCIGDEENMYVASSKEGLLEAINNALKSKPKSEEVGENIQ